MPKYLIIKVLFGVWLIFTSVITFAQGDQWVPASQGLGNLDVRKLALGPGGELYAGTWGDGVYRSSDQGASWTRAGGLSTKPCIAGLAVDGDGYVYAVSQGKRYDLDPPVLNLLAPGGAKWSEVPIGMRWLNGISVAPDKTVYLGFASDEPTSYPTCLAKIYNHGQTVKVDLAPNCTAFAFLPQHTFVGFIVGCSTPGVRCLEDPSLGTGNLGDGSLTSVLIADAAGRLYAAIEGTGGKAFFTDDLGRTFTEISQTLPQNPLTPEGYPTYAWIYAMAARQPGEVFLARGLSETRRTYKSETTVAMGVFRRNGDKPWEDVSAGLDSRDVCALVAAPDGTLYAATAGAGVFRSTALVPIELASFTAE